MKKTRYAALIASILGLGFSSIASAEPLSIGIGGGITDSPYKGYGTIYNFFPHVSYDNGLFFIDDLSAGVYAYNVENQSLSIGIRYLPMEFKPHDSDNHRLKQLDKRHSTLLAEIEYDLDTNFGSFSTSIGADVLNESNSILLNADYSLPLVYEPLIIVPKIGIGWADGNHNDYYYGVSHKESSRSGLRYHNADSSFTPYAELSAQYPLTQHISTYGGVRVDKLTGDAADSPMVNSSIVTSVYMGMSYKF